MKDALPIKVALVRSPAIDPAVNKVARALAHGGYAVDLLVWSREGRGKENDEGNCYHIHRFSLKAPYYKPSLLFYYPIWWLYEFLFLLRSGANVIHACDFDTLIPAILVKVIKRTKLCYTIYDFYADILPEQVPGAIRKCAASIEKFGIRFTDILFLIDETRYEQVRGAKINRLEYIYNSPEDCFDAKTKLEHSSKISIFYAGYLDKSRGLEEMINAAGELDDIKLTIAGTGPSRDIIEHHLAKLHNLQYLGQIPYEEVIANSLNADILFAFYEPEIPSNKYASPNKLFEAMMCAKPIIVNEGTTASKIVAEEKCGLIVPYGDVEAIREAILRLRNDPELRRKLGENGRKAYENHYSWDIMRNRLINAYHELAKSA